MKRAIKLINKRINQLNFIILNSVRQHNHFYYSRHLHRLHVSTININLQVCFCHLIHKMLCTLWDPIVLTSMEYIKCNNLPQRV